jgi:Cof subfamily protein (haloacid dehalogenase superfamily)
MSHNLRLIAIDLDGTLLNSQQEVTSASRTALQRIVAAGIQVILVTGRGLRGVETVLDMLEMDLPYICSAGSLIRSGRNGEVISVCPFHAPQELNKVIAYIHRNDAGLVADLPDGKMCWYGPDWLMDELDPLTAESVRDSIRTFTPEQDFDRPILKMSIAGKMDFLNAIEVEVLNDIQSLQHVYAGLHFMDLTARGVDKGSALKIYADRLGISHPEIAAIGDQPIDLPMLAYSGLPIAMQNAPESVKQSALWVAPTNDEDGVSWALLRILNKTIDFHN